MGTSELRFIFVKAVFDASSTCAQNFLRISLRENVSN